MKGILITIKAKNRGLWRPNSWVVDLSYSKLLRFNGNFLKIKHFPGFRSAKRANQSKSDSCDRVNKTTSFTHSFTIFFWQLCSHLIHKMWHFRDPQPRFVVGSRSVWRSLVEKRVSGKWPRQIEVKLRKTRHRWLGVVVSTPLKNMSSSVGMMTFPTEWNNKSHVQNHQPDHHALLAKAIKGYMTQSAGEETWRLILREVQGLTSTQFLSAQLTCNFENITSGHKRKYVILCIYIIWL